MYNNYSQIIRVTGENGARAFQLMPNSSALLLDETAPLVWLCVTDGAGYKTITPYKIEKYTPEPQPDINSLIERITKIERRLDNEPNIAADERTEARNTERHNNTVEERKPAGAFYSNDKNKPAFP